MNLKKLSVKNFIGDLPRIINESLDAIQTAFTNIYDDETNTIGNNSTNIKSKTIEANDIIVSGGDIKIKINDKPITITELYDKIRTLEFNETELYNRIRALEHGESTSYGRSILPKKKLQ